MKPAGFGIRFLAYILDSLILSLLCVVVMIPAFLAVKALSQEAPGLALLVNLTASVFVLVLSTAYIVVFWAKSGATPGKKILQLKIIREDGIEPLGYGKAFLRLLGYAVNNFTMCIGYLVILFNDEKKGLHDMIAGTRVVRL